MSFVATRDHRVMKRVNGWRPPRWFRMWMLCATRGGDGWLWYAMGLCLLLFDGLHALRPVAAAAAATAAGVTLFIASKSTFRRRRPCAYESNCWVSLLPPDQFSFPSGHSITAFAVALPLGLSYPGLMPGLLFCAASVAISRIMLGMHFLSDVIAGSLIGALLGYLALTIV